MGHSSSIKKAVRSIAVMGLILGGGSFVYAQGGQAGGTLSGQSGASEGQGQVLSGQSSSAGGPREVTQGGPAAGQGMPSKKGLIRKSFQEAGIRFKWTRFRHGIKLLPGIEYFRNWFRFGWILTGTSFSQEGKRDGAVGSLRFSIRWLCH